MHTAGKNATKECGPPGMRTKPRSKEVFEHIELVTASGRVSGLAAQIRITGTDAKRHQREQKRITARGNTDTESTLEVVSHLRFEMVNGRTQNELLGFIYVVERLAYFVAKGAVLRAQINDGNFKQGGTRHWF